MNKTPSEEGKHEFVVHGATKVLSYLEITSTLTHLKLSTKTPQKPAHKPKSKPVADSWDEELSGSDTETETGTGTGTTLPKASARDSLEPISTVTSNELSPNPPPPTPASPPPFEFPDSVPYGASRSRMDSRGALDKRPEKTTAVAGRLIAGALGVRAPKRTDEEREFDKAMREKERKRRTEEKERERKEKEEVEARKKAVWDD
jgi:hypothetical protein